MNKQMKRILVATANSDASQSISDCFHKTYLTDVSVDISGCLDCFKQHRYEFLFIDINFLCTSLSSSTDLKQCLRPFWEVAPTIQIVILTTPENVRHAIRAMKAGASDYLTYPLSIEEIQYVAEGLFEDLRLKSELNYLRDHFWKEDSIDFVKTNNDYMKQVFDKIKSVAATRATVLLTGETGTGKGVLARLIHHHSNRSDKQFISVHCGAIPDTLLESELFGHEKGAFTGAVKRRFGKFEIAHGGTIFLDEIGTLTPSAQIKLLQVLQDKCIQRVGGEQTIQTDVRVIAATNADLEVLCSEGVFRKDLFYRLNVFPIRIPSLQERPEDIPIIIENILKRLNRFDQKNIKDIHTNAMKSLQKYNWPGNIRELENVIERSYILETSSYITPESLPSDIMDYDEVRPSVFIDPSMSLDSVRRNGIEEIERQYLKEILTINHGRIDASAQTAGISTRQLHKLLKKHALRKEDFKKQLLGKNTKRQREK